MRLIDANEAYEIARTSGLHGDFGRSRADLTSLQELFENCTPIDAVSVVHGQWILEREPDSNPYCFHCSVCDNDFHYIGINTAFDYCPNCGAKMDGGIDYGK